jgi:hypothetical protein
MPDEKVEEKQAENKPEEKVAEKTVIDYEKIAKGKGWKPKDEFAGEAWVDAEEFVKREPLFERIKQQSSDLKEMKKTIETMAVHYKKVQDVAVQKAISDLKTQKKEAIEVGDVAKVEQIDKQIDEQKQIKEDAPATVEIRPEIKEWVSKNKWFDTNNKMQKFALSFNKSFQEDNPSASLGDVLEETTKAVKIRFPEEFIDNSARRESPAQVESPSGAETGKKKGYGRDRLISDAQRQVYDQCVKNPIIMMKPEDYVKNLETLGYLGG